MPSGKIQSSSERVTDLAHQVEPVVEEVAAEHVEAADAAVGLGHVDPEGGTAVAVDREPLPDQLALEPEGLADHVDGVVVPADVAEVDVAVVPDEAALAHRTQQGAVGQERLDAALLQAHAGPAPSRRGAASPARRRGCRRSSPAGWTCRCRARDRRRRRRRSGRARRRRCAPRRGPSGPRRARPPRAGCCRRGTCAAAGATGATPSTLSRRVQNDQIRRPSKSTSSTVSSADSTRTPSASTAVTRSAGPSGIRLSLRRTRWPASGPRRSRPPRCGTGRCRAPRP